MGDTTAGDPISGLKWTHKSLRVLEGELARGGYVVSAPTISRLLQSRAYSLRVNHKRLAGKQSPGRTSAIVGILKLLGSITRTAYGKIFIHNTITGQRANTTRD